MLAHPFVFGLIGVANIIGRCQLRFTIFFQSEGEVLGMIMTVARHHIEHHSAEHLLRIRIGQLQFPNRLKQLIVTVSDLRWAGVLPLMFMRSSKLSATTKLSENNETPPIANVLLAVCTFSYLF